MDNVITIIAYKPNSDHYTRCGDRYSYDSDLQIFSSTDIVEMANKLAEFNTYQTKDYEEGYECRILINGHEESPAEYASDEYYDFEDFKDKIMNFANSKTQEIVAERKRQAEQAELNRKQAEEQRNRQAAIARENAERAQYEALRAKFGGK